MEERRMWNFKKGYRMKERWSRHETSDQYAAFQEYLRMPRPRSATKLGEMLGYTPSTVFRWSKIYNWDERAAAWDKNEIIKAHKDEARINRQKHREAIQEFRNAAEEQARGMLSVSADLTKILQKRLAEAQENEEEIPMNLVSGLLRATASINEQGRQSWAAAIGVDQLMEVVDVEVQAAEQERERGLLEAAENEDDPDTFEFELDE